MSVWGKVSGAAAGLLVGGPVGALVGAVAGHFIFDRETDPGVAFTMGRDLVLEPRTAAPLNYFIYPHAEANGAEVGTASVALEFRDM